MSLLFVQMKRTLLISMQVEKPLKGTVTPKQRKYIQSICIQIAYSKVWALCKSNAIAVEQT